MNKISWKVIITSNGTAYDITNELVGGNVQMIATDGLSNFSFDFDNTNGKYKDKIAEGSYVDVYYAYKNASDLTTVRFRGYIDGIFDNFALDNGFTISIEGRDCPKGHSNKHLGDTEITIQFAGRNTIDCWLGASGSVDAEGNYADGLLYNTGMILRVYDAADSSWKNYKDLTDAQKTTLKAQTGYTSTVTKTFVDKTGLTISKENAMEGDYDFHIWYDSGNTYFMVQPEEAVKNNEEAVVAGQNLISLNRYGRDTTEEVNRVKEKGYTEGPLITMRTKEDEARQAILWIKDKTEMTSSLEDDAEIAAKASARVEELKRAPKKGNMNVCMLPTLRPAQKLHINLPYIINDWVKVKSFSISGFVNDLECTPNLQDRETTFERMFKDRIDENVDVTPTNNPNGMLNALIFNFTEIGDYTLVNCKITGDILSLEDGETSGTCVTPLHTSDENIESCELRIKSNQYRECTYRISNDNGLSWEEIALGEVHEFISTGKYCLLEINLKEASAGVSPEFDLVNLLYK